MLKTCVYCEQDKPEEEFDLEHIWPDALGGDLLPALFQTNDVCQRCNNLAGLFVDGAFLKSWFGQAERATGAYDYVDLDIRSTASQRARWAEGTTCRTPVRPLRRPACRCPSEQASQT
jgi:HNH endonuclease